MESSIGCNGDGGRDLLLAPVGIASLLLHKQCVHLLVEGQAWGRGVNTILV
jgi:hypothetical protein